MTRVDDVVPTWPRTMLRPQLELRVGGPREQALEVLARTLHAHDFRTRDASPDGFRARYWRWAWMLTGETAHRTELDVRAGESTITIRTVRNAHESPPAKRAAEGINAAVAELRARGVAVHWTPWTDEDPRMKRKQGRV